MRNTIFVTAFKLVFCTFIFVMSMGAFSDEGLNYEEAKLLAKEMENRLSKEQRVRLEEAQGQFLVTSVISCMNQTQEKPMPFTVVVKMDQRGKVIKSWSNKRSEFLTCFEAETKKKYRFQSGEDLFYSFIKVNL